MELPNQAFFIFCLAPFALYAFVMAEELIKSVYDKLKKIFYDRKKLGNIEEHSDYGADLCKYFDGAYLNGASVQYADLNGANLQYTDIWGRPLPTGEE